MRKYSSHLAFFFSAVLALFLFVPSVNTFAATINNEDNDALSCGTELRVSSSLTKRSPEDDNQHLLWTSIIPQRSTVDLNFLPPRTIMNRESNSPTINPIRLSYIRAPPKETAA